MKKIVKVLLNIMLGICGFPIVLGGAIVLFGGIVGFVLASWAYDGDENRAAMYAFFFQLAYLILIVIFI